MIGRAEVCFVKVFVSVDMEGISGVVNWEQTSAGNPSYEDARALMAGELRAAVEGLYDGGATEILVNDSHANGRNIKIAEADPRVRLITGGGSPLSMMQGIDETFDAAVFVGYHAGAGTAAVLSHTYNGTIYSAKLNSRLVGEITINAAVAGYFGVPVVMVTGDSTACREALSSLGPVEAVAVKEPITRYAADCLHPEAARERIRTAAAGLFDRLPEFEPFSLEPPIRFELAFTNTGLADAAGIMPGAVREDATTIGYASDDFLGAYRGFLTMTRLAGAER